MTPLPFHPSPGDILVCDYSTGFKPPEMIKRRLCVAISPKLKRRNDLITIVPLSQSCPEHIELWHHKIELRSKAWGDGPRWAVSDMLATVAYARLSRPHYRHPITNARLFERLVLSEADLKAVRNCVLHALGLGN